MQPVKAAVVVFKNANANANANGIGPWSFLVMADLHAFGLTIAQ